MIEKRYFHVIRQHFAEGLFEKTLSYDQAKEIAMLVMSHVNPNERRQREQQELAPVQKELPAPEILAPVKYIDPVKDPDNME